MSPDRFTRTPKDLRRRGVKLDNVALVPASLLPYKQQWQRIANELPKGSVLICIPGVVGKQREVAVKVVAHLRGKGTRVATFTATSDRHPL